MAPFRVGLSHGLGRADGTINLVELGLEALEGEPNLALRPLDTDQPTTRAHDLAGLGAVIAESLEVGRAGLDGADDLVLVARYGVGYDSVDLAACTERGIMVTNAPDGVRRPMAAANLAMLLAISMRLVEKDRLTRSGRWDEGSRLLGTGLAGKTLGLVGMGNIGAETIVLARPLDMQVIVHDPFVSADRIKAAGAIPASLHEVLQQADFLILSVPLVTSTRHLIGREELRLMRSSAYIINTTRGPVIDEAALVETLHSGGLAGAALDVFDLEPVDPANPLLAMDNVIVTPHSLGSTDECFTMIGRSVARAILDVASGHVPSNVVNRDVLDHPRLRERLDTLAM